MQTLLSIIIPIYNVESYVEQCVESVVRQLGERDASFVEVILIDDGSTDRSGAIADRYARKHSAIQAVHRPNAGTASARNAGMDRAKGDWLYFMDSDDWLAEDGISLLHRAIGEHPASDMILLDGYQNSGNREKAWEHFGHGAVWNDRGDLLKLQRGILYYPMDYPGTKVPLAAPWDKLYRREFLTRHGIRFREKLRVLDDLVFNMEVLGEAQQVAYAKYQVYHYRHVASSITNAYRADRVEQDSKVWEYIERYRSGWRAENIPRKNVPREKISQDDMSQKNILRESMSQEAVLHEKISLKGITCHEKMYRWKAQCRNEQDEAALFDQAYYCRVVKSFAICCKLNFYHQNNCKSFIKKQEYVRKISKSSHYAEAFQCVKLRHLEWKLRIVVLLVRCRLYGGLYLAHLAQRAISAG